MSPDQRKQKKEELPLVPDNSLSGPPCHSCGTIMQRAGSCYVCPDCGETSGCG